MPFPHSPDYPYTLGGRFQYTDANNIEDGVAGAYTELESITANDGTALPSSNGPFTLANFINYLTTLIKSIVGGAHWYSAVPTSLTSLSAGKANVAGDTFTGQLTIARALGGSDKSFLHLNATDGKEYQLIVGTGGTVNLFNVTDSVTVAVFGPASGSTSDAKQVWTAANDGAGSGLDADTVDGLQASAFAQLASAANFTAGLQTGGKNVCFAQAGLTGKFSAQSTAPASPSDGDLWLDTSTVLS